MRVLSISTSSFCYLECEPAQGSLYSTLWEPVRWHTESGKKRRRVAHLRRRNSTTRYINNKFCASSAAVTKVSRPAIHLFFALSAHTKSKVTKYFTWLRIVFYQFCFPLSETYITNYVYGE